MPNFYVVSIYRIYLGGSWLYAHIIYSELRRDTIAQNHQCISQHGYITARRAINQ